MVDCVDYKFENPIINMIYKFDFHIHKDHCKLLINNQIVKAEPKKGIAKMKINKVDFEN